MKNKITIEREGNTIIINIHNGGQIRFIDMTLEQARELLYKLQSVDLSEVETFG